MTNADLIESLMKYPADAGVEVVASDFGIIVLPTETHYDVTYNRITVTAS